MLNNAYLLAKIVADTAENEQHFAEILPIGRRVADRRDDADARVGALRSDRHARSRALRRHTRDEAGTPLRAVGVRVRGLGSANFENF